MYINLWLHFCIDEINTERNNKWMFLAAFWWRWGYININLGQYNVFFWCPMKIYSVSERYVSVTYLFYVIVTYIPTLIWCQYNQSGFLDSYGQSICQPPVVAACGLHYRWTIFYILMHCMNNTYQMPCQPIYTIFKKTFCKRSSDM